MTEVEYDEFLKTTKAGRYARIGEFINMSTGILHKCSDTICAREWKPSPLQSMADDYVN